MDSLKRWPWLSKRDADLLNGWHEKDPNAAREYERHLDNERYSDEQFYRHNTSLDGLLAGGGALSDEGEVFPPDFDDAGYWWQTAQDGVYPD